MILTTSTGRPAAWPISLRRTAMRIRQARLSGSAFPTREYPCQCPDRISDLFDAAALMHPLIPFEPKAAPAPQTRRVLITAGERDPICPVPMTKAFADYLKAKAERSRKNGTLAGMRFGRMKSKRCGRF